MKLLDILSLSQNATAIYNGEDLIIQTANDAMISFWGKDRSVIGMPLAQAVPELKGQPFIGLLQNVWHTGVTYETKNAAAELLIDGKLQHFYFDFMYRAILNEAGETDCILHTATDVTELNLNRAAANEALQQTRETLWTTNRELQSSQKRLNQILTQLPAPVVLLSGPYQVIETTNEALLTFWNKKKEEVIGKPMLDVFPELENQPFPAQWKQVFETGETIINREKPVVFNRPEGKRLFYVDYHYQPLRDLNGNITGVLATVIDNTDKVMARKAIEESEEKLKLAVETGNMGTWSIALDSMKISMSAFVKNLLGLPPDQDPEMEAIIQAIDAEYHPILTKVLSDAINHQQSSDTEYSIHHLITGQKKWVRATGKVFRSDKTAEYAGIFMDITEQKQDEQRKNDFIGMVSHELKTPLTSLSGYTQLLQKRAKITADTFTEGLLEKSYSQVKKMTAMINGFLNVSRLESGKIQIDKTPFLLNDLIGEIIAEAETILPQHTLTFSPHEPITVHADRDKIGSVISNLLSNAIKYSPNNKMIG